MVECILGIEDSFLSFFCCQNVVSEKTFCQLCRDIISISSIKGRTYMVKKKGKTLTNNFERLANLYMDDRISLNTLYEISMLLKELPLPERDYMAAKIMDLVDAMASEQDLILMVRKESREWMKEF